MEKYNKQKSAKIKIVIYSYAENLDEIVNQINNTEGKKKILLLSDLGEFQNASDTNIFLTALNLKLGGCIDETVEVLAEIVNPANYAALKNIGVMSVILSNKIISLFMVQLLTHPGSKVFYRDIISTNEANDQIDLEILKADELLKFDKEQLSFSSKSEFVQSFYFSSNQTKMCIGIKFEGKKEIEYLCDKMDENYSFNLSPNDQLVLVSYS